MIRGIWGGGAGKIGLRVLGREEHRKKSKGHVGNLGEEDEVHACPYHNLQPQPFLATPTL